MKAYPVMDGTHTSTFICMHMARRLAVIGGTFCAYGPTEYGPAVGGCRSDPSAVIQMPAK
jgi:hypothetical protein